MRSRSLPSGLASAAACAAIAAGLFLAGCGSSTTEPTSTDRERGAVGNAGVGLVAAEASSPNDVGASGSACAWTATEGPRCLTVFVNENPTSAALWAGRPASALAAPGRWTSLALGPKHTCLTSDGTLWCTPAYTEPGREGASPAQEVATPGPVDEVALGSGGFIEREPTFCVIDHDSGGVLCKGLNNWGQAGQERGRTVADFTRVQGWVGGGAAELTGATRHFCARTTSNDVWCWGRNSYGELGIGAQNAGANQYRSRASLLSGVQAISIEAGSSHTCAAEPSGAVKCWGYNGSGGLGDGTTTDRPEPVRVLGIDDAVAVAAGYESSCAIRGTERTVWCWGGNRYGELGDGTRTQRTTPVQVRRSNGTPLRGVQSIAMNGGSGAVALTQGGETVSWGFG